MFFQSIYQMITAGTDLNINIRKVNNSLSVAVMPRRNSLKEDTRQNMVPLVVNGTPAELDMGFLQTILQPIQKVQGLLVNAENFEKQAEKATSQAKSSKTPFRETSRKGYITGQIIQGSNNTGRIKGSQGKTGKDGKTPKEG